MLVRKQTECVSSKEGEQDESKAEIDGSDV